MKIGKYFTLEELTVTNSGLANTPTKGEINSLGLLVREVLDPVREKIEMSIHVNSGYRSPAVNKAVGGAATSQHSKGEAADLVCADNAKLFHAIRDNFVFDQLIWEKGNETQPAWVHVSYRSQGNRCEVLKFDGKKYVRI